jgi:aminoglycoside 2'-N-acetyltransferase I
MATRVEVRHTSQLDASMLVAARTLLDAVFEGDFSDADWEHALGGMHVLLHDGDELIGHGSVVQRRVLHAGRALRCGYVEAIGVRADRRRQGHGARIMSAIGELVRGGYAMGALGASDDGAPLYRAHGWTLWEGETFAFTPDGITRTPDTAGALMVLDVEDVLDPAQSLTCDWRDGDVW